MNKTMLNIMFWSFFHPFIFDHCNAFLVVFMDHCFPVLMFSSFSNIYFSFPFSCRKISIACFDSDFLLFKLYLIILLKFESIYYFIFSAKHLNKIILLKNATGWTATQSYHILLSLSPFSFLFILHHDISMLWIWSFV